jgi:hypothetical protein
MERHGEETHFLKRMTLPSGRTIEVVYLRGGEPEESGAIEPAAEPHQKLGECLECSSALVYPVQWEEAGPHNWRVLLRCPNCELHREGVFSQATVEAYDVELDEGAEALLAEYERLVQENMGEEIDRFVGALEAGAILPEDFAA